MPDCNVAQLDIVIPNSRYEAVINHSDELAHIAKFYNLKSAS